MVGFLYCGNDVHRSRAIVSRGPYSTKPRERTRATAWYLPFDIYLQFASLKYNVTPNWGFGVDVQSCAIIMSPVPGFMLLIYPFAIIMSPLMWLIAECARALFVKRVSL